MVTLHQRLRRGQYVAQPVKRIWIDKEGGKQRPIGITALEDKIVQKVVGKLLDAVYDRNGVRGNYKVLEVVYESTEKAWRFWLTRRSRKGGISWSKFEKLRTSFPFPNPKIIHNI